MKFKKVLTIFALLFASNFTVSESSNLENKTGFSDIISVHRLYQTPHYSKLELNYGPKSWVIGIVNSVSIVYHNPKMLESYTKVDITILRASFLQCKQEFPLSLNMTLIIHNAVLENYDNEIEQRDKIYDWAKYSIIDGEIAYFEYQFSHNNYNTEYGVITYKRPIWAKDLPFCIGSIHELETRLVYNKTLDGIYVYRDGSEVFIFPINDKYLSNLDMMEINIKYAYPKDLKEFIEERNNQ